MVTNGFLPSPKHSSVFLTTGGRLYIDDPVLGKVPPRNNFNTFYWAVISVFEIICVDNWNNSMYLAMASIDAPALGCIY